MDEEIKSHPVFLALGIPALYATCFPILAALERFHVWERFGVPGLVQSIGVDPQRVPLAIFAAYTIYVYGGTTYLAVVARAATLPIRYDNHLPRAQVATLFRLATNQQEYEAAVGETKGGKEQGFRRIQLAARIQGMHENCAESFPYVAVAMFIATLCDVPVQLQTTFISTYVFARLGHSAAYSLDVTDMRSTLHILANTACLALLGNALMPNVFKSFYTFIGGSA
ncbi:hypothetical protein M427DRAFT_129950 [Gonapodya prolifera JEL478]|uniref:Uncharacterized protein n=1 Tax=Gonapodya prolifera (strain JEL478) TaxID=1344416 RepID=A0A139AZS9_GONPJ|nr:hypothetical protein M427DRAFT_129950 [Gonapodya prolifera JEL478]|eukprot:KXS22214.1 hypothetical protein M427DRAFT_129950 [Gonapodya prolifera JEL478]